MRLGLPPAEIFCTRFYAVLRLLPTVRHSAGRSRRPSASNSSMSYLRSKAGPVSFPSTKARFPIRSDPTGTGDAVPSRS